LAGKVLFLVSGKISESDSSDSLLGGRKKDQREVEKKQNETKDTPKLAREQ